MRPWAWMYILVITPAVQIQAESNIHNIWDSQQSSKCTCLLDILFLLRKWSALIFGTWRKSLHTKDNQYAHYLSPPTSPWQHGALGSSRRTRRRSNPWLQTEHEKDINSACAFRLSDFMSVTESNGPRWFLLAEYRRCSIWKQVLFYRKW